MRNSHVLEGRVSMFQTIALHCIAVPLLIVVFAGAGSSSEGDSYADTVAVRTARYAALIAEADSLYSAGEYDASADRSAAAFRCVRIPAPSDIYNAAVSAALAGRIGQSYGFLHRAVEAGAEDLAQWEAAPALAGLRAYPELWAEVRRAAVRSMQARYGATFDPSLAAVLETLYVSDQNIRREHDALTETYGPTIPDSVRVPFEKRWASVDGGNLSRLEALVAEHGWLNRSLVGDNGAKAAWLIVQHAPLDVQERYLPILQAAVAKGQADPADLALLTDRVLVGKGKPQRYGSQLRQDQKTGKIEFFPIEDAANVNTRRATVGLGPIEEYARLFGIDYEAASDKR